MSENDKAVAHTSAGDKADGDGANLILHSVPGVAGHRHNGAGRPDHGLCQKGQRAGMGLDALPVSDPHLLDRAAVYDHRRDNHLPVYRFRDPVVRLDLADRLGGEGHAGDRTRRSPSRPDVVDVRLD